MSKFYTTHYIEDLNCIFIICVFVRDTKYNVNEKKNLTIALTMIEKNSDTQWQLSPIATPPHDATTQRHLAKWTVSNASKTNSEKAFKIHNFSAKRLFTQRKKANSFLLSLPLVFTDAAFGLRRWVTSVRQVK